MFQQKRLKIWLVHDFFNEKKQNKRFGWGDRQSLLTCLVLLTLSYSFDTRPKILNHNNDGMYIRNIGGFMMLYIGPLLSEELREIILETWWNFLSQWK